MRTVPVSSCLTPSRIFLLGGILKRCVLTQCCPDGQRRQGWTFPSLSDFREAFSTLTLEKHLLQFFPFTAIFYFFQRGLNYSTTPEPNCT